MRIILALILLLVLSNCASSDSEKAHSPIDLQELDPSMPTSYPELHGHISEKLTGFNSLKGFQSIPDGIHEPNPMCMEHVRTALSPGGAQYLKILYSLSGKFVNELGNPELCRDIEQTEYVMMKIMAGLSFTIGLCVPNTCGTPEDFAGLKEFLIKKAKDFGLPEEMPLDVQIMFPYKQKSASWGAGGISTLALLGLITVLGIVGSFTEYIPLFRKPGSLPSDKPEKKINKLGLALHSFSFKTNLQKLFHVSSQGDDDLAILNGIRVFSICWVIAGHVFMIGSGAPMSNILSMQNMMTTWYFVIVPGGFFAVDVFFMMSGFLTFYLLTVKMYPKKGWTNFPMVYFHRWFRLFTPAAFCILLTNFVFKHLGSGPSFQQSWNMNCEKYWWSSLIFINNLVPWNTGLMCMSWFWYLANDFEFFLISPIIIFFYCRNKIVGYALVAILMLVNYIVNMVLTAQNDLGIMFTLSGGGDFFDLVYMKPWSRFAAYGVGAIFGFMYYEYKQDKKKMADENLEEIRPSLSTKIMMAPKYSTLITYFYFFSGLFLTSFFVFIQISFYKEKLNSNPWSKTSNMLYNAFGRSFFVLGLILIIIPTFQGRLPWIKHLLGNNTMIVLGRITFGVYLMHIPWIIMLLADSRQGMWVSNLNAWWLVLGIAPISFLFAIPFSMYAEVPFMNLEKHFLMPKPPPKKIVLKEQQVESFERINKTVDSEEPKSLLLPKKS
ncbi:unnamed protein product [Moneuplotes crassus]|uniref:Acyltransferase 3 domain-containing protein n=1 Tax=Euplotes crassus TaxID=5936 RepID=A0AAD2DA02_EUPCR|nr:unnamed protein product [Moneuplotes crassus]